MRILARWLVGSTMVIGCAGCGDDDGAVAEEAPLSLVSVEEPGANCPAGGQVVRAGLDHNGDGQLDQEEVVSSSYVCNGSPGAAGQDAAPVAPREVLTELNEEDAGRNCTWGGKRLDVGQDANADGELDQGEITSSSFFCGERPLICFGSYRITSPEELSEFAAMRCDAVDGDLTFASFDVLALEGLSVRSVRGDLTISGMTHITALSGFENLEHVGGDIRLVGNPALKTLSGLEGVIGVDGQVQIVANEALASVAALLDWDQNSAGGLQISDNPSLPACQVEALDERFDASCERCVGNTGPAGLCDAH